MKAITSTILLVLALGINFLQADAQQNKIDTTEFNVEGVCDMCKSRIENAAYIKGVKSSSWNKETKVLTLIYKKDKTDIDQIHQNIAGVGHDTDKAKANEEAYAKLPACCAYRDGIEAH